MLKQFQGVLMWGEAGDLPVLKQKVLRDLATTKRAVLNQRSMGSSHVPN